MVFGLFSSRKAKAPGEGESSDSDPSDKGGGGMFGWIRNKGAGGMFDFITGSSRAKKEKEDAENKRRADHEKAAKEKERQEEEDAKEARLARKQRERVLRLARQHEQLERMKAREHIWMARYTRSIDERKRQSSSYDKSTLYWDGSVLIMANKREHERERGLWSMGPPHSKVRIFCSSTFTDTHDERNLLLGEVYKNCRNRADKAGLDFSFIDMRYGVRDENTLDHMTWESCRAELIRCRDESAGLFFLSLQGEKYGYRPLPKYIPKALFDVKVKSELKRSGQNSRAVALAHKWYLLDENALPARYTLRNLETMDSRANNDTREYWDETLPLVREMFSNMTDSQTFEAEKSLSNVQLKIGNSVTEWEALSSFANEEDIKRSLWLYRPYEEPASKWESPVKVCTKIWPEPYDDGASDKFRYWDYTDASRPKRTLWRSFEPEAPSEVDEELSEEKRKKLMKDLQLRNRKAVNEYLSGRIEKEKKDVKESEEIAVKLQRLKELMYRKYTSVKDVHGTHEKKHFIKFKPAVSITDIAKKNAKHKAYLNKFGSTATKLIFEDIDRQRLHQEAWRRHGNGIGLRGEFLSEMFHHLEWALLKIKNFEGRGDLIQACLEKIERENDPVCYEDQNEDEYDDDYGEADVKTKWPPSKAFKGLSLAIIGASGSGKTSLVAAVARALKAHEPQWKLSDEESARPRLYILRFCGTSNASADGLSLMRSICMQIHLSVEDEDKFEDVIRHIPHDYEDCVQYFHTMIAQYPVVLIIDSLDQLSNNYKERSEISFLWGIKPHKDGRIVVTSLPDDEAYFFLCDDRLARSDVPRIVVTPLIDPSVGDVTEVMLMAKTLLEKTHGRQLTEAQWGIFRESVRAEPTALYVNLAVNSVLQEWSSYDDPSSLKLAPTVRALIEQIYDNLYRTYGEKLVEAALCILTLAEEGISDVEMQDILTLDDDVLNFVFQYSRPTIERLPYHVWLRIRASLGSLLVEKDGGCLQWYHRQLREVGLQRFSAKTRRHYSALMGRYFANLVPKDVAERKLIKAQPFVLNDCDVFLPEARLNRRRCVEGASHLVRGGLYTEAIQELCTIESLYANVRISSTHCFNHLQRTIELDRIFQKMNAKSTNRVLEIEKSIDLLQQWFKARDEIIVNTIESEMKPALKMASDGVVKQAKVYLIHTLQDLEAIQGIRGMLENDPKYLKQELAVEEAAVQAAQLQQQSRGEMVDPMPTRNQLAKQSADKIRSDLNKKFALDGGRDGRSKFTDYLRVITNVILLKFDPKFKHMQSKKDRDPHTGKPFRSSGEEAVRDEKNIHKALIKKQQELAELQLDYDKYVADRVQKLRADIVAMRAWMEDRNRIVQASIRKRSEVLSGHLPTSGSLSLDFGQEAQSAFDSIRGMQSFTGMLMEDPKFAWVGDTNEKKRELDAKYSAAVNISSHFYEVAKEIIETITSGIGQERRQPFVRTIRRRLETLPAKTGTNGQMSPPEQEWHLYECTVLTSDTLIDTGVTEGSTSAATIKSVGTGTSWSGEKSAMKLYHAGEEHPLHLPVLQANSTVKVDAHDAKKTEKNVQQKEWELLSTRAQAIVDKETKLADDLASKEGELRELELLHKNYTFVKQRVAKHEKWFASRDDCQRQTLHRWLERIFADNERADEALRVNTRLLLHSKTETLAALEETIEEFENDKHFVKQDKDELSFSEDINHRVALPSATTTLGRANREGTMSYYLHEYCKDLSKSFTRHKLGTAADEREQRQRLEVNMSEQKEIEKVFQRYQSLLIEVAAIDKWSREQREHEDIKRAHAEVTDELFDENPGMSHAACQEIKALLQESFQTTEHVREVEALLLNPDRRVPTWLTLGDEESGVPASPLFKARPSPSQASEPPSSPPSLLLPSESEASALSADDGAARRKSNGGDAGDLPADFLSSAVALASEPELTGAEASGHLAAVQGCVYGDGDGDALEGEQTVSDRVIASSTKRRQQPNHYRLHPSDAERNSPERTVSAVTSLAPLSLQNPLSIESADPAGDTHASNYLDSPGSPQSPSSRFVWSAFQPSSPSAQATEQDVKISRTGQEFCDHLIAQYPLANRPITRFILMLTERVLDIIGDDEDIERLDEIGAALEEAGDAQRMGLMDKEDSFGPDFSLESLVDRADYVNGAQQGHLTAEIASLASANEATGDSEAEKEAAQATSPSSRTVHRPGSSGSTRSPSRRLRGFKASIDAETQRARALLHREMHETELLFQHYKSPRVLCMLRFQHYHQLMRREMSLMSSDPEHNIHIACERQPHASLAKKDFEDIFRTYRRKKVLGKFTGGSVKAGETFNNIAMPFYCALGGRSHTFGPMIGALAGHTKRVQCVCLAPGNVIVSGSGEHEAHIRLWDLESGLCTMSIDTGHMTRGINAVAASQKGDQLIYSASHNFVSVWNAKTGKELSLNPDSAASTQAHEQPLLEACQHYGSASWQVRTIVLHETAHDTFLVSGADDSTIRVWHRARPQGRQASMHEITRESFQSMGMIGTPLGDPKKNRKKDGNGRRVPTPQKHVQPVDDAMPGKVLCLALSRDGSLLLAGGGEETEDKVDETSFKQRGVAKLYSVTFDKRSMRVRHKLCVSFGDSLETREHRHKSAINSVAIAPDNSKVVTCGSDSDDTKAIVWDTEGQLRFKLSGHSSTVHVCAFSPDGNRIMTGSWDHDIRVWDAKSGDCSLVMTGHLHDVTSMAITPDGSRLVSGSDDCTVGVWSLGAGKEIKSTEAHQNGVLSLNMSDDGSLIASCSVGGHIKLHQTKNGHQSVDTRMGGGIHVSCVALSADNTTIVAGGSDKAVHLISTRNGSQLAKLLGHKDIVNAVVTKGDTIVSGGGAGDGADSIKLWSLSRRTLMRSITVPKLINNRFNCDVNALCFARFGEPDGSDAILVSGDSFGCIRLWDLDSGKQVLHINKRRVDEDYAPIAGHSSGGPSTKNIDGKALVGHASAIRSVHVTTYSEKSGSLRTALGVPGIDETETCTMKTVLVTGASDDTAILWDVISLDNTPVVKRRVTLEGHSADVRCVLLSPDGSRAFTCSGSLSVRDNSVRMWDAITGQQLMILNGHTDIVRSIVLSPSCDKLYSTGDDTSIMEWQLVWKNKRNQTFWDKMKKTIDAEWEKKVNRRDRRDYKIRTVIG